MNDDGQLSPHLARRLADDPGRDVVPVAPVVMKLSLLVPVLCTAFAAVELTAQRNAYEAALKPGASIIQPSLVDLLR